MHQIDKTNFNEIINSSEPTLIKFSAIWCGSCKVLGKTLEDMKDSLPKTYEVDVDENMELCEKYKISNIPVLMLFNSGELVKRHNGLISKEELKQFVK